MEFLLGILDTTGLLLMQSANQVLDDCFLEVRAKLLEIAATLDRIDRSSDEHSPLTPEAVPRRDRLGEAVRILLSEGPDRAERLQLLFSRDYDSSWREQMKI